MSYWDWSWGNLKNQGSNFFSNPSQAMENPWFRMGMGLLSENQKPYGGDPFGAIMGGMSGAKKTKEENEDRKAVEEQRKRTKEWFDKILGRGGGQSPGAPPAQAGGGWVVDPQTGLPVPAAGSRAAANMGMGQGNTQVPPHIQQMMWQMILQDANR